MHPNQAFRSATDKQNLQFAQDRSFGTLCVNGEAGPVLAHVPFRIADDGQSIEAHLVRSNPMLELLTAPVVLAVTGADGYISPDWYGADDQVPTWNYVAVHIRGTLVRLADEELAGILERLSTSMEERLNKPIWTMDKVDDDKLRSMMRQIVPIRLDIESIDGTWKLSQNKPEDVRLGAASHIDNSFGSEVHELKEHMRHP